MEFVQPIRDRKQIDAIKYILKSQNIRDYVMFTLGINSGLRISDLLKLKDTDVLDEFGGIKEKISLMERRTGKYKDFPVPSSSAKALAEYLGQHSPTGEPLFPSRKPSAKNAGTLTRVQAYRIINQAARAAGIKGKIGTHTIRKTFGYHAHKAGVDITLIQKLFNHSAPSVTLAYIGITQDELDSISLDLNL